MIQSMAVIKPQPKPVEANPYDRFGPGAESKLRIEEAAAGVSKKINAAYYAAPVPEGRMRAQEQSRFVAPETKSQDFDRRHAKSVPERKVIPERKVVVPERKVPVASVTTAAPKVAPKNPFDDEDDDKNPNYDESKNPFADEDEDDNETEVAKEKSNSEKPTSNPFGEYDSN